MYAFKLLVALSLLTNADAVPVCEAWPDVFPFAGWDGSLSSESKAEYLFFGPFMCLGDVLATEVLPTPNVRNGPALHALLAEELREVAIRLEILDPRETGYLLHEPQNFLQDLKQLQHRFQELVDAPAAAECARFPDRDAVGELLAANRAYREELCQRLEIDPVHTGEIQDVINELDQLHQVWNTVREARCGFYYVNVRRGALKHLRELIGEPAYYRGELPPHLPDWRLPRSH